MYRKKLGRPPGASRHKAQDDITLDRMADLIATHPGLSRTASLRRLGYSDSVTHRRLRRKWEMHGLQRLAAAHERRQARAAVVYAPNFMFAGMSAKDLESLANLPNTIQKIASRIDPTVLQRNLDKLGSLQPMVQAITEKLARFAEENPDHGLVRMAQEPDYNPFAVGPLVTRSV